ncbi:DUF5719 family protein [Mycetocola zhadangensis]|uniref:Large extracellular alpha-helical protein n=1 Tax=Mycetocola zhadangensis TaxID=1164595 RepID=A0A3L7IWA6_9MICO|nr:DUF5719 family protein [Mycetocola zhadangensis]RLQ81513.1 hypothetical protein D9V28_14305 [Mycetocola zhadangensis]RLQ82467.1 hypothetical protein D9V28_10815 [Mycetocola zhadangensis]GGF01056.1 hypothetical protein GCM10011313_25120 [Mycetocola zhadangensis]
MADKRRVAKTSGRLIAGIVGVGIAGASVFAVGTFELPRVTAAVPSAVVTPTAADQARVCAGPLVQLAGDGSSNASSFGAAELTVGSESEPTQTPLVAPNNLAGDAFGSPIVVSEPSATDATTAPLLAAAQSQSAALGDLSGFAASACAEPSAESWLVGGSTDVGRTSVLALTNPTRSDAIVDIAIFGEGGAVDAPGSQGIIVKAGEQKLLSLAAFAPNLITPVVHVTSRGGQVAAVIQHSVVRGLTPHGVEYVAPTAPAANEQFLSGIVIAPNAPVVSDEDYDDNNPALRMIAPGTEPADVTVSFTSEQGGESPQPLEFALEAGIATEISLRDLPVGSYTVEVSSTQPVVAGARTSVAVGESSDLAWFQASTALPEAVMVAVPAGETPVLHLANPERRALTVELEPSAGETITAKIPAGTSVALPVAGGASYQISGAEGAIAQLSVQSATGISAFAVQPANPSATPVTVYPR